MLQVKTNFLNFKTNEEDKLNNFLTAIEYASNEMQHALNVETLSRRERELNRANNTESEKKAIGDKIKKLKKTNADIIARNKEIEGVYTSVLEVITAAEKSFEDKEGKKRVAKNSAEQVKNLLRLLACGNNRQFFAIAIEGEINFAGLYNALSRAHTMDADAFNDYGKRKQPKTDADYKEFDSILSEELQKVLSVRVANDYTNGIRFKFNKHYLSVLHETFISGVTSDFQRTKNGNVYNGFNIKTSIQMKTNREGVTEYDTKNFRKILAQLAYDFLMKKGN